MRLSRSPAACPARQWQDAGRGEGGKETTWGEQEAGDLEESSVVPEQ